MQAFFKLEKFDNIKIKNSFNSSNSWLKNTDEWFIIVPSYFLTITQRSRSHRWQ